MAIPLDANPNHGSDNRIHDVVGSAFRDGPSTTQSGHAEHEFEPTKSYQSVVMVRQELGLDGCRLIVHKWLVAHTRKGKDGAIPPQHREGLTSVYSEKTGQGPIR